MKISNFFLVIIFTIAGVLRFWNLTTVPVALSHDEVAIGYNAWSILQTGKDEYGHAFPMLFQSFDDYKLPGLVYLTAISERIFGLNEFAVRFPSAFFGTLSVVVFYFLLKQFILTLTVRESKTLSRLPVIGAFFFAISPWHINFSRQAFESNVSLFFILLAVLFLFISRNKIWVLVPAAVASVTAVYFYYTARVLMPVLIVTFLILYGRKMFQFKKHLIIASLVGVLLIAPLVPHMFSTGLSRINQVSIFNDESLTAPYSQAILRSENSLISRVVFNRRIAHFQQFTDNYLKNLAPDFLFTNGTNSMGLLYIWELPFFILGIIYLSKIKSSYKWVFFIWFLSVPLVGGFSVQQPNPLRTLGNVPIAVLFSSVGVLYAASKLKEKYIVWSLFRLGLLLIAGFFFVRFLNLYFNYEFYLNAERFGDGNKEMVQYINKLKQYDLIYISGDRWRPYAHYLFFSKYDPALYQKTGTNMKIDNLRFGSASWDLKYNLRLDTIDLATLDENKTLFILTKNDYETQSAAITSGERAYKLKIINEINGKYLSPAFYAIEIE